MSGQNTASIACQVPPSFEVYVEGWGSKHYFIGQPKSPPIYAVSLHTGWSGKPDIILHSGPTENDLPLATSNKRSFGRSADVTLPPLPGMEGMASGERIEASRSGFGSPVFFFSIEAGATGRRERFEWRHSRGNEVAALGGRSSGWKLVRIATDAPGGTNTGATFGGGAKSSDGKEVVAVWAATTGRLHKGFRFQFLGTGANGSLGQRWATMAVISALRCWNRERRAQNSGTAAGV